MKTDELIKILGTDVEPVDHRQVIRTLGIAVAVATLVALSAMLFLFGARADLNAARAVIFLLVKLAFTIGLVILSSAYLIKLARPGGEQKVPIAFVATPFVSVMMLAAISLAFAPVSHWDDMIVGDHWFECLLSIPVIAIAPFAVIIWALHRAAPTNLIRAGALGGLAAGAVSATGYALHCVDDSLPFVALWYGGAIVICTIAGAVLGRRLLRW